MFNLQKYVETNNNNNNNTFSQIQTNEYPPNQLGKVGKGPISKGG